jgi:hypothetical protein
MCSNLDLFHHTVLQKCGETSIVLWITVVSKDFHHPAIQTKIEQHFDRLFHRIKVRQTRARQHSMQTVIRTTRRLDSFLHEAAHFQIFKSEIKKSKTYSS